MRIMLLTNCYPPEIGAAANQLYELAQELTRKGHQVKVVTRFPRHIPKEYIKIKGGSLICREKDGEIEIIRVNIPHLPRFIPFLRELEHLLNVFLLFIAALLAGRTDVTLVYSPPIVVGYTAVFLRFLTRSKVVLNVQDLFPQSFIDVGIIKNPVLIKICKLLERTLYRWVDFITVHSENNRLIVSNEARRPTGISVVPNWVDTNYIVPRECNNDFRAEFILKDKFVVSFAGCMGEGQDMDIILDCAHKVRENKDIVFLLAGNGPKFETVKQKVAGMDNVKVIPIQPRGKYVNLLAASNISIVTLNKTITTPVIPSKILSIMSSGRPIIASLPAISDGVELIEQAKCGICVKAGDSGAFQEAILRLYRSPELCAQLGKNGREHAVKNFSLEICANTYEDVFNKTIGYKTNSGSGPEERNN